MKRFKYRIFTEKDLNHEQLQSIKQLFVHSVINEPFLSQQFLKEDNCDFYVFPIAPCDSSWKLFDILTEFDIFDLNKQKCIFFDYFETDKIYDKLNHSILLKTDTTSKNKAFGLFYNVFPNFYQQILKTKQIHIKETKYDICFQGTLSTNALRRNIPDVIRACKNNGFSTYFKEFPKFFYHLSEQEKIKGNDYCARMIDSKFILCPKGNGLSSYRLYETLSIGRIPVIYSDELVLPLQDYLNWKQFSIRIPEKDMLKTHEYIKRFIDQNNLIYSSYLASSVWSKYFNANSSLRNFLDISLRNF